MLGTTRHNIRTSVRDALLSIPAVQSRVVSGVAVPSLMLPNITYNVEAESISSAGSYMLGDERELFITIEARTLIRDGSDSPIDDLCLEIERVIATSTTIGTYCTDLRLDSTTYELDESDIPIGLATLAYLGYYNDSVADIWVAPQLVGIGYLGVDLGSSGASVRLESQTSSSCQVRYKLSATGASKSYITLYTYPEQQTPHLQTFNITEPSDRGLVYDLYWSWVSGSFHGDWVLVEQNAIRIPEVGDPNEVVYM